MINGLKGKIIEEGKGFVTVEVSGICYKVFVSEIFLQKISELGSDNSKDDIFIRTFLSVRENALDLYGFIDEKDKGFFELLLTISGVGPKSALTIMSSVTREMVQESIQKQDAGYLSKISGIGKKTAEKIVLSLKDKLIPDQEYSSGNNIAVGSDNSDSATAIDALVSLGYTERDARNMVQKIDTGGKNTEEIIKEALKNL